MTMAMARKIVVNGADITDQVNALFISLEITDAAGRKSDSLTLTLTDDGKIKVPDTEATLDVWTGRTPDRLAYRGQYTVGDIDLPFPERQIVIHAAAAKLRGSIKNQRSDTWPEGSLYDVAYAVAERNGFTPAISVDLQSVIMPHRIQRGQSDADLLQQLADEFNCTLSCKGGRLVFFPLGDNRNASGQVGPAIPLHLSDHVRGIVNIKGSAAVDGVRAAWRDVDGGKLNYAVTGDAAGRLKTLPGEYDGQTAAEHAAAAEWHRAQRKGYQLHIQEMPAIVGLQAERLVTVSGHPRSQFNDGWMIEEVVEHQDNRGFWQSLKAVTPKQSGASVPGLIKR